MWSNTEFFRQGYGKFQESEESGSSQESEKSSQSSQSTEMESSIEEKKSLDPWYCIQEEVVNRHLERLNALAEEYEQNGDTSNMALTEARNVMPPTYRKELRKTLLEYLQWMHGMMKDSTFCKVMETQRELKETEGLDWLESIELAIDKRKFLLNRLFSKLEIPGNRLLAVLFWIVESFARLFRTPSRLSREGLLAVYPDEDKN